MANGKEQAEQKSGNGTAVKDLAVPPVQPIARSWVPVAATVGTIGALAGVGYLGYSALKQQGKLPGGPTDAPPSGGGEPADGQTTPAPAEQGQTPSGNPGVVPPADFWGTTERGLQYRPLLAKLEEVTRMPVRLFLSVVTNREADWQRKARNKSKVEVDASARAITNGVKRGNPKPKFADSLAQAGSGGLFGALAPYVAWTGMDEGYMPFLDMDWTAIEDPVVAAVCAAKYYQRVVANYPTVFASGTPTSEDNFRVRLGWASPATLKDEPAGKLFAAVRGRMEEDLAELGLKITDLPPPNASRWPGFKVVHEAMKSFVPTWK